MFWLFCKTLYKDSHHKKFPVGINDGVGDTIFLPLYNAFFAHLILSSNQTINMQVLIIAILSSLIFSSGYLYYSLTNIKGNDWSRPRPGKLNFGGVYHLIFFFFQTTLLALGIIMFYDKILIWVPILGFLVTVYLQYFKKGFI